MSEPPGSLIFVFYKLSKTFQLNNEKNERNSEFPICAQSSIYHIESHYQSNYKRRNRRLQDFRPKALSLSLPPCHIPLMEPTLQITAFINNNQQFYNIRSYSAYDLFVSTA